MKKNRLSGVILLFAAILLLGSCQKKLTGAGYVFDKTSRQPIEGALVQAYLDHPSSDARVMSTYTAANGGYYVYSQPYSCTGTCPEIVVEISKDGYETEIVRSPNNDTTYLVKSAR